MNVFGNRFNQLAVYFAVVFLVSCGTSATPNIAATVDAQVRATLAATGNPAPSSTIANVAPTSTAFAASLETATNVPEQTVKLHFVSLSEMKKLVCGERQWDAGAGFKFVLLEVAIENVSTNFQGSDTFWQPKLSTREGFDYDLNKTQFGACVFDNPYFTALPPGFRLLKRFLFQVGESTQPSRLTLKDTKMQRDIDSISIADGAQQLSFPVGDRAQTKIETLGVPHILQPYTLDGLLPKTPKVPAPRAVKVISANYSDPHQVYGESVKDLVINFEMENQSSGENALFALQMYVIGSDGLVISPYLTNEQCGLAMAPRDGICAGIGPGQTDQRKVTFYVAPDTTGHYLVFVDNVLFRDEGWVQRDPWVVDLGK